MRNEQPTSKRKTTKRHTLLVWLERKRGSSLEIIPVGVGLFYANAYTYTPSQKYDVILVDLWDANDITDEEKNILLSNYENYLNEGGKIILPITYNSL